MSVHHVRMDNKEYLDLRAFFDDVDALVKDWDAKIAHDGPDEEVGLAEFKQKMCGSIADRWRNGGARDVIQKLIGRSGA